MIKRQLSAAVFWLAVTSVFMVSIGGFRGLYSGTQLYHFVFGLAKAGVGELGADWFANTKNPWLVFEYLVRFSAEYLGEPVFYVYQFLLVLIYIYSLVGIADHFF